MPATLLLLLIVVVFSLVLTGVATARAMREPLADARGTGHPHSGGPYFLAATLFFAWVLIHGSLVPYWFVQLDWGAATLHFARILSRPIAIASRSDWVGNILVAVPLGFFGLATLSVQGPTWLRALGPLIVLPAAAAVSLGVEFAQVWNPVRVPSAADVVAQALGAGLGACLWLVIGGPVRQALKRHLPDPAGWSWLEWCLSVYLVWLVIEQLLPLDLTLSPNAIRWKYQWGAIRVIPFTEAVSGRAMAGQLAADVLRYVPVGYLLASWNRRAPNARRLWSRCLGLGILLAGGVELAQVFVFSRSATSTDMLSGLVGVALGVALARLGSRRRRPARSADLPGQKYHPYERSATTADRGPTPREEPKK